MEEIIFKPKYPAKMFAGLLVFTLIESFLLWLILSGKDNKPEIVIMAVVFGLVLASLPRTLVRRIVFNADAFLIEKFLWPTKTIEYTDVTAISLPIIKTRSDNLTLPLMLNSNELHNTFAGLIKQGKINRCQH